MSPPAFQETLYERRRTLLHASWILSLPEGFTASTGSDGRITVDDSYGPIMLPWKDASITELVMQLQEPGLRFQDLAAQVEQSDVEGGIPGVLHCLRLLARQGLLWMSVGDEAGRLATLVPTSASFSLSSDTRPQRPVILSRFAYTHRVHDHVVVESPTAHSRVLLHGEQASQFVHRLNVPTAVDELASAAGSLPVAAAEQLLQLLWKSGLLTEVVDEQLTAEDEHDHLKFWEFHDLLFHATSREGRHDGPVGATFFWAESEPPLPPLPNTHSETAGGIDLERPDLTTVEERDPALTRVMEDRASLRDYAEQPMTAAQLGEFLYRVGRVRDQFNYEFDLPGGAVVMDFASRPYPSAGGVYELEIYPLIQNCAGLEAGLYHYNALAHRLEPTVATEAQRTRLLRGAGEATGVDPDELQVLLIVAARFGRMTWKYSGMAYAAILKDVGSLYQTMYLTATAMGLAPCGIGSGNSDLFADAIGSDYYAETSVGEFLLGSAAADEST